jgi:tetratricopeptide (TPR) repeat protein
MELNPNAAMTNFYFAHLLSNSYQHDQAIALIEHARELDPVSPVMRSFHGQFLFDARRYAEALEPIRQAIEIAPGFFHGHEILSRLCIQLGDYDAALEECELAYRLSGGMLFALARKGYVLAKMRRHAEAAEVMSSFEQIARERFVAPFHFALIHAGLGNRETALEYLEQSVKVHAGPFVLVPTDPLWDDLRSEPRFQALMRKCGFPEAPATGTDLSPKSAIPLRHDPSGSRTSDRIR